jgi:hypothetical protein
MLEGLDLLVLGHLGFLVLLLVHLDLLLVLLDLCC